MAYVISNGNNLVGIAANDTDKNECNLTSPPHTFHSISDEDFAKLKNNTAVVTINGSTVTITDHSDFNIADENELWTYINRNVKLKLKEFLDGNNSSKAIHSDIQNYSNYIDNTLQMASLTYPLNSSWEKYCEDNSITYVNPLQIL